MAWKIILFLVFVWLKGQPKNWTYSLSGMCFYNLLSLCCWDLHVTDVNMLSMIRQAFETNHEIDTRRESIQIQHKIDAMPTT